MHSVSVLEDPRRADGICRGHEGKYRELVRLGDNVWGYYLLTRKQLRFWRKLNGRERRLIARKEAEECFLCALDAAEVNMERFEEGLYSALMRSLFVSG